jgi:hypothetical protein
MSLRRYRNKKNLRRSQRGKREEDMKIEELHRQALILSFSSFTTAH